jgi:hypothetical protein
MPNLTNCAWRRITLGALALGALALSASLTTPLTALSPEPNTAPTFAKDIAPIFQVKCESCHRPDSIAPMSLITYEDVYPRRGLIRDRVVSRQMPPWHLDKTVGIKEYKYDRSLSDAQIDTIVRWIDAGAPRGDMKDMPTPMKWPAEQGWNFAALFDQPEPDLIIRSTPYTQKAGAHDAWWKPSVPTGLTEQRWVRAIEIRPSTVKGRKVVHHAIARLQQSEQNNPNAQADTDEPPAAGAAASTSGLAGGGLFMEWAVGKQGEIMRPNSGKLMLPGSRINWDIHYSDGKEDVNSVVELGIYFYPKGQEPKYRQYLELWSAGETDIAPNEVKMTSATRTMNRAGRIEGMQPHMHLRGQAMMLEAILPGTSQRRILTYVNNFNFNWHNTYVYADDAAPLLPKGTTIIVTAWHDNTTAKKSNPDPNQYVGYGDRTVDEMNHAWVNVTYMSDEDYEAEVKAREARLAASKQAQAR